MKGYFQCSPSVLVRDIGDPFVRQYPRLAGHKFYLRKLLANGAIEPLTEEDFESEVSTVFSAAVRGVTLHLCTKAPQAQAYYFEESGGHWNLIRN